MWRAPTARTVLLALVLGCAGARAADGPKPEDPDPRFLEFLGSVDRLSEVNPDYLSQAGQSGKPPPKPLATPSPPPPPPPPPPPQPPPAAASAGVINNEG
jgi:hypothetical protein